MMSIGSGTWIANRVLGSAFLPAFNPTIVPFEDSYLLFYRQSISRHLPYTRIRVIRLDKAYRSTSKAIDVAIPKISPQIRTFDDPRAFWWKGSLWLLHTQASHSKEGVWATCVVLTQVFPDGRAGRTFLPEYGRNINESNRGTGVGFEKNWTPLVVGDDLFLIYQIHPIIVLKVRTVVDGRQDVFDVELVDTQQSNFDSTTHLSGGTPLIRLTDSTFIGMYHTYTLLDAKNRRYAAGFYTVDTATWKFTALSRTPALVADAPTRRADLRASWKERIGLRKRDSRHEVVFPGGLIDRNATLDAAVGWNDCRVFVQRFHKASILADLRNLS